MHTATQLQEMTPADKRKAKDYILADAALYTLAALSKQQGSDLFKSNEMKALRARLEKTRTELIAYYGNSLSVFSYTHSVLRNITELMLETTDDLELSRVVAYVDAIRDNDVAIVPDAQYKELLNAQDNDTK